MNKKFNEVIGDCIKSNLKEGVTIKDVQQHVKEALEIKKLKKELGLNNSDIADFFDLTPEGYANSSAKRRYEKAICSFYAFVKSKAEKENKTCTGDDQMCW